MPDTARFPPPPSFFAGWDRSPAHNATEAEAEAGERWCAAHPLAPPQPRAAVDPAALAALLAHNPRLLPPVSFDGRAGAASLACTAPGAWECVTDARVGDSTYVFVFFLFFFPILFSSLLFPSYTQASLSLPT